ncbi:MAG: methionine--tRNA ligase subunit beta, partial [Bacteroidetes bacterium]|nr:methionine--tRNA ligase subunit beta [Bacteroidota bacterium]
KMSTSRNHAVWLHEYLNDFPEKEDVLRYVLCSIMPEQKDADFTWKDYQARNNNELVKILGNLINRIIILTNKYFQGVVPDPGDLSKNERAMEAFSQIHEYIGNVENSIENFRFREAQSEFMNVARVGNKYLTDEEPWKKWKTDPEAVKPALYVGLQIIAQLGILAKPFLPRTAEKIFDLLNIDGSNLNWDDLSKEGLVEAGHTIQTEKVNVLFEQIEDKVIDEQKDKLEAAAKEAESKFPPMKEEIEFEDFQKMDIRIGTILEASKVEKADKLLQFKVDTGIDVRTIVSGVAKHFEPEFMVGKQIPVLMNLKPRKIRGVVSQGMILFAEDSEEALHLLTPQKDIESGSSVN